MKALISAVVCLGLMMIFPFPALAGIGGNDDGGTVITDPGTNPHSPEVTIEGSEEEPSVGGGGTQSISETGETWQYLWLLACSTNHPEQPMTMCAAARTCPVTTQLRWTLWSRQMTDSEGSPVVTDWLPGQSECYDGEPPAAAPLPVVTDDLVLSEVRRLGLPRLTINVQPEGETLVNLETIFYAEPPVWTRTVQLLGYTVDVEATVATYNWSFGDGGTASTTEPGAPYPATDIVHEYADAHVQVSPRVDVAYRIRYRVDGAAWQTIAETVPAAGYPVDLIIREATPVLVGD